MLVRPGKLGWIEIHSPPEQLIAILKSEIPQDARFYDGTLWHVRKHHLLSVVRAGYEIIGRVDYHLLPGREQLLIAQAKSGWVPGSLRMPSEPKVSKGDPYATLYLLPTAPYDIVKVVFWALVNTHHPDKGGEAEEYRKIVEAFEEIKDEQGS